MAGYPPPLPPPQKKKRQRPTWETHDWSVVLYNASYALHGFPLIPPLFLVCLRFSVGGGGSSFVSVFGGSRLGRCQSTSRHGTRLYYAQSAR